MDASSVEFWSAGVSSAHRRDRRAAAAEAAAAAVNIRSWDEPALRQLAVERGLESIEGEIVEAIEAHTALVRASPAAKVQLGGWLGGHVSFREYGASLEEDAFVLVDAFSSGAGDARPAAMSVPVAATRVRRLGAGVRRLAASVHAHGLWEERAIFDFLKSELRTFAPFHSALAREHRGADEVAQEIERLASIDWGRAASAPSDLARELCEGVVERLADAVSEFVSHLAAHLEREEECVVPALLALKPDAAARFQRGLGGGSIAAQVEPPATDEPTERTIQVKRRPAVSQGCCGGNEWGGCCSY